MTTVLLLSFVLGALLSQVLPQRKTSGKWERPTEADFQAYMRSQGL